MTVWLGVLEISTGKLTAANAGHEYPAVKQAGGSFELLKDKHGFVGRDGDDTRTGNTNCSWSRVQSCLCTRMV